MSCHVCSLLSEEAERRKNKRGKWYWFVFRLESDAFDPMHALIHSEGPCHRPRQLRVEHTDATDAPRCLFALCFPRPDCSVHKQTLKSIDNLKLQSKLSEMNDTFLSIENATGVAGREIRAGPCRFPPTGSGHVLPRTFDLQRKWQMPVATSAPEAPKPPGVHVSGWFVLDDFLKQEASLSDYTGTASIPELWAGPRRPSVSQSVGQTVS